MDKQIIAIVNSHDKILGKIEKLETHKKGVLHRAFTVIITYKKQFVLQHRKHPAFDGFFDLSFSSHQLYINNVLQNDLEAIYSSLKREWNVWKEDLKYQPEFLGKIYYKARDKNSSFIEHEIDYIYRVEFGKFPTPNYDFAYGFSLIPKSQVPNPNISFAPWVKEILKQKII